ncbi:MAG: glycoside hydrolase family 97 protein [Rhizobacter sp.]|nr:glycoside hydrolase family 97 protein [Chlorobiales bacterium]
MKKPAAFFLLCAIASLSCAAASAQDLASPDGRFSLSFRLLSPGGEPAYQLSFDGKPVVQQSKLGLELKDSISLAKGFTIAKVDTASTDETWNPVWGEVKTIRNTYKELAVTLQQSSFDQGPKRQEFFIQDSLKQGNRKIRTLVIRFRLFNDGLGFRYEFPVQPHLDYFTLTDEKTEFKLTGDHKTFWMPGDYDTNEYLYTTSPLSAVDALKGMSAQEISTRSIIAANAVQTPLMMKTSDNLYINIHEAALVNYPAMNLLVDRATFALTSHLVPGATGDKAYLQTPCKTPWRTVIASPTAAGILESKLILNLNEPSKIQNTDWIKPMKFVGIWWELHVGKTSWNYADTNNITLAGTDWTRLKPNGRHGATTENTKRYIDFATKHGFGGVLVEGWDIGWEDWFGRWKEEVFDFVTPYPDFNVKELQRYAAKKKVKLIMHHETSSSVTNYERRMDEAYRFMKANGYDAVKTGYVGKIIPRGEHHDGQWMVNHYVHVAGKTAEQKIMVDMHEPVRPTGLHRTYPNWLACEAARGNEFNAWSIGNMPEHETILPFTRMMGGPMDYTPGIFQIKLNVYSAQKKEQVHTTLAKQLALYVTLYSPLQMAADLPENYEKSLDAFQFIKDVPVDWDDTKILEAEPGDYLTVARKAKGKEEWYIGAITDENARTATVSLGVLTPNRIYVAALYSDAADAHWEKNPMAYKIERVLVNYKTVLNLKLAAGGGAAISLKPASAAEARQLKFYK